MFLLRWAPGASRSHRSHRTTRPAVYGFGGQKTPEPFVNACSRFLYLDKLAVTAAAVDIDTGELTRDESGGTPLRVPAAKLKRDAKLVGLLRNAVEAAAGESGWARVGAVGQQIGNQASFDPRNYGYATLTKLLKATELFQLDKEGTSEVSVRDIREVRGAKA